MNGFILVTKQISFLTSNKQFLNKEPKLLELHKQKIKKRSKK